jgi:uncharacterized peroxidase-related enzyme
LRSQAIDKEKPTLDNVALDDSFKTKLIADWRTAELSETNKLILEFAEKTTLEAHAVTQDYVDNLKQNGFSDQMIHDVVMVTSYFNFINRLADALGVELEE